MLSAGPCCTQSEGMADWMDGEGGASSQKENSASEGSVLSLCHQKNIPANFSESNQIFGQKLPMFGFTTYF